MTQRRDKIREGPGGGIQTLAQRRSRAQAGYIDMATPPFTRGIDSLSVTAVSRRYVVRLLFLHFCIMLFCNAAAAQKVALVIGNGAYTHAGVLKNPINDANALGSKLESLGFHIVKGLNLNKSSFRETIVKFARQSNGAQTVVIFYAGHALQVDGQNYLIPVDANIEQKADLRWQTIRMQTLLEEVEQPGKTSIIILDACRNNPLARKLRNLNSTTRTMSIGRGLARMRARSGSYIAFATAPDEVAADGEGENSPFTNSLLRHIEEPNLDVAILMRRVRYDVHKSTNGLQTPWSNSSLLGSFSFNQTKIGRRARKPDRDVDIEAAWNATRDLKTCEAYRAFSNEFAGSFYARLARAWQKKNCYPEDATTGNQRTNFARQVQARLRVLGCYSGKIDGIWGSKSRRAVASALGTPISNQLPSKALLEQLHAAASRCSVPATKKVRLKTKQQKNRQTSRASSARSKNVSKSSSACSRHRKCVAKEAASGRSAWFPVCGSRPSGCTP